MTQRLQSEWEKPEIPDEVLLRARNRAWARIQDRTGGGRRGSWLLASATVTAAFLLVVLWPGSSGESEIARPPTVPMTSPQLSERPSGSQTAKEPPTSARTPAEEAQTRPERQTASATVKPRLSRKPAPSPEPVSSTETVEAPRRLEITLTLPETGVRMLWVLDDDFENGGTR